MLLPPSYRPPGNHHGHAQTPSPPQFHPGHRATQWRISFSVADCAGCTQPNRERCLLVYPYARLHTAGDYTISYSSERFLRLLDSVMERERIIRIRIRYITSNRPGGVVSMLADTQDGGVTVQVELAGGGVEPPDCIDLAYRVVYAAVPYDVEAKQVVVTPGLRRLVAARTCFDESAEVIVYPVCFPAARVHGECPADGNGDIERAPYSPRLVVSCVSESIIEDVVRTGQLVEEYVVAVYGGEAAVLPVAEVLAAVDVQVVERDRVPAGRIARWHP